MVAKPKRALTRGLRGPYSRARAIAKPPKRSMEDKFCKRVRSDLLAQLGPKPTTTQRLLVDRVVMVLLRIELMDAVALRNRDLTESQAVSYLAWNNTASRMLRALGLKEADRATSLDHLSMPSFAEADLHG